VASESQPPEKDEGGGNLKWLVLGLLLIGGAVGVYFALNLGGKPAEQPAGPVAQAQPDLGTQQPSGPEVDIEIPPEEPDLGPAEDMGPPRKIIRYVYTGGGGWDCSGDIPDARNVMNEAGRQVRACYERRLKQVNTLQGTVTLSLKVGRAGNVEAVQVGGSLRDNDVFACVRSVAQTLRFTAPVGGACAVVQQPYNLSPRN
jgi:outer membrane biosynthesis protein TonB